MILFNGVYRKLEDLNPVYTSQPKVSPGEIAEYSWIPDGDHVEQVWTVRKKDSNLSTPEQRLDAIEAETKSVRSDVDALSIIITGKEVSHGNQ